MPVNPDVIPTPVGVMQVGSGPGWPGCVPHGAVDYGLRGYPNRKGARRCSRIYGTLGVADVVRLPLMMNALHPLAMC